MARTSEPHSAKGQFYINLANNKSLNPQPDRWGYTVFGYVIEGMGIIDEISKVPTGPQKNLARDVPQVPIIIKKVSRYSFE